MSRDLDCTYIIPERSSTDAVDLRASRKGLNGIDEATTKEGREGDKSIGGAELKTRAHGTKGCGEELGLDV